MSISLNNHESRIKVLENSSIKGIEIDAGKVKLPASGNRYTREISFNKKFVKVPCVTMNGSHGTIGVHGDSEGAVVINITTTGFQFHSQWERLQSYELNWIAISVLYRYRTTSSFIKEVLL